MNRLRRAIRIGTDGFFAARKALVNRTIVGYSADAPLWLLNHTHLLAGETLTVRLVVFVPVISASADHFRPFFENRKKAHQKTA